MSSLRDPAAALEVVRGEKYAVETQRRELLDDDFTGRLSDDQIAADIQQNMLHAALRAAVAKADAIQFAMPVKRGNENRRRIGLDRGTYEFFLAHHHAEVDDMEAFFGQKASKIRLPTEWQSLPITPRIIVESFIVPIDS